MASRKIRFADGIVKKLIESDASEWSLESLVEEETRYDPVEKDMTVPEFCNFLSCSDEKYYDLRKRGFLGKTKYELRDPQNSSRKIPKIDVSVINEIQRKAAISVRVSEFYKFLSRGELDMGFELTRSYFDKLFNAEKKMYKRILRSYVYVTIDDAIEIIKELKLRFEKVHSWKTVEDFNKESGLNLSPRTLQVRIKKMIKSGELKTEYISVAGPVEGNRRRATIRKIDPLTYNNALALENNRSKIKSSSYSIREIQSRYQTAKTNVHRKINRAEKLGVIEVHRMPYEHNAVYIGKEDADFLFSEISLRDITKRFLEQRWEGKYSTKELSEIIGMNPSYVSRLINLLVKHKLIKAPKSVNRNAVGSPTYQIDQNDIYVFEGFYKFLVNTYTSGLRKSLKLLNLGDEESLNYSISLKNAKISQKYFLELFNEHKPSLLQITDGFVWGYTRSQKESFLMTAFYEAINNLKEEDILYKIVLLTSAYYNRIIHEEKMIRRGPDFLIEKRLTDKGNIL